VAAGTELEVAPFEPRYVAEAALLAARHVAEFRRTLPLLPERWTQPAVFADRLTALIDGWPAAVALVEGRLVGYLAALGWERAGLRCVFSPEWANVCVSAHARLAREQLYATVAERWIADGRTAHFIGLLPIDTIGFRALSWLGFGHSNVDGLRGVDPIGGGAKVDIVAATPADAEDVLWLELRLRDHLSSTPLFFEHDPPPTVVDVANVLADASRVTLLTRDEQGPLGYLRIGPASDDASTIIRDQGTASITRAFTRSDRRGGGVATALLDAALQWASERGYVRCAVDYESANLLASRFWARHFQVVGIAVRRRI
jgi:GNAT superfamily N-acetyltransferase